jgi:periplasmic protein TonB
MKSAAPITATLLLHLALIAVIITGLSGSEKAGMRQPLQVSVALLPPVPPKPVVPAPAAKPVPPPSAKRKPRSIKARRPATPSTAPAAAAAGPTAKPIEPPSEPQPAKTLSTPSPTQQPQAASVPAAKTDVSIPARYAAGNQKPRYPQLSRAYGEQGTVVLRVLVQPDGRAGAVEIKTSSGYPLLDEAAQTAVQEWRFNPATVDGKPIARWSPVPIQFKLPDN